MFSMQCFMLELLPLLVCLNMTFPEVINLLQGFYNKKNLAYGSCFYTVDVQGSKDGMLCHILTRSISMLPLHITVHVCSVFCLLSYILPLRFPYQFLPRLLLGLSVEVEKMNEMKDFWKIHLEDI